MWKALKYAWIILKALITLAVALGCLLIADSKVFTVLVCLLILIYVQNVGTASMFGRVMYNDLAKISKQVRQIRAMLGIREDSQLVNEEDQYDGKGEEEDEAEDLSVSEQIVAELKKQAVQEFVFLIQNATIHLVVLFFLIKTVFF